MHPHLPGPALLDVRTGSIIDNALQEASQITNNCVINACKQPFGSWLIKFHSPFYHCLQKKEGSGSRMLLVGCGPVLTPLPCRRFGCNPEPCTHLAHAPVFSSLGGQLCPQNVIGDPEKGHFLAWVLQRRDVSFCRMLSTQIVEEAPLPRSKKRFLLVGKPVWGSRGAVG